MTENYQQIRSRVQAAIAKSPYRQNVTMLAVSKTQPIEKIRALYQLGHRDFGENYVQELIEKAQKLQESCPEIRWHFIGHLQSNKVKQLLPYVQFVHSVDSVKLAKELSKRQAEAGQYERLDIYLQVNLDGESSKSGVTSDQAPTVCAEIAKLPGLNLLGLMCIPDPQAIASVPSPFARLKQLEQTCQPHTRGYLSMGMSSDFEEAIREGATIVRLGTIIFGTRS